MKKGLRLCRRHVVGKIKGLPVRIAALMKKGLRQFALPTLHRRQLLVRIAALMKKGLRPRNSIIASTFHVVVSELLP